MAMEAISDKESDGSLEEDNEGKEKTQEKKSSSKVCTTCSNFCVFYRHGTGHVSSAASLLFNMYNNNDEVC